MKGHRRVQRRAPFRAGTTAIVSMLLLSACGGDAGSGGPTTTSSSPTTSPPTTAPATQTETETEVQALDYYAGKTLTIVLPVGPGGAVDTTARFWADWLPRYLEGNPPVVIENMPGGNHILAGNHFDGQVERDGLTLTLHATTGHFVWRFNVPGVDFDVAGWEPLISNPGGDVWYASPENSGITSLDDLIDGNHGELFFAGQQPNGSDLFKVWAFHLLDIPVNTTWGYDGRGAGRVAFEQGEANIDVQSAAAYPAQVAPLIESGEGVLLFSMGQNADDGTLARDEFWADIPHIGEVYEMMHGEPPSGEMLDALMLGGALARTLGRTLYVHADAPPEAIAALRDAVEQMVADPEYLAASFEALGEYTPRIGQAVRDLVRVSLLEVDQAVIDFMIDFVRDYYDEDLLSGG